MIDISTRTRPCNGGAHEQQTIMQIRTSQLAFLLILNFHHLLDRRYGISRYTNSHPDHGEPHAYLPLHHSSHITIPHPLFCKRAYHYCHYRDSSSIRKQGLEIFIHRKYLLLMAGIKPNPGPRAPKYPCGVCSKACKTKCIACDDCGQWMHKSCIGLTSAELIELGKSENSWTCLNCQKQNNSCITYTVPHADTDGNLSTNPGLLDNVSDISHSTRVSTSTEPDMSISFNCSGDSYSHMQTS